MVTKAGGEVNAPEGGCVPHTSLGSAENEGPAGRGYAASRIRTSENASTGEVPRISLPRTRVNKPTADAASRAKWHHGLVVERLTLAGFSGGREGGQDEVALHSNQGD